MKVKLTKIGIPQNADYPSETDKSKVAQDLGGKSPWVDYEVIGDIRSIPEVGESLFVSRTQRNGVEVFGYFRTSKIKAVCKNCDAKGKILNYNLITQNSIYRLEILNLTNNQNMR